MINQLENLGQIDKFLEKHALTKLTGEEIEYLNGPSSINNLSLYLTFP